MENEEVKHSTLIEKKNENYFDHKPLEPSFHLVNLLRESN